MFSFSDIFTPTFMLFLGILLIALGIMTTYYENKFSAQHHKLNTMLSLISSLAEEVNSIKFGLNQVAIRSGSVIPSTFQPFTEMQPTLEKQNLNKLIEVSDEDEDEDDDEDDDEDEDEDDDEDDEDEDDEDEDDEDEDDDEEDDDNKSRNIKILKMDEQEITLEVDNLEEEKDESIMDFELESISSNNEDLSETLEKQNSQLLINSSEEELMPSKELDEHMIDLSDIKTINIMDIEDSKNNQENETTDYKKMSVQKLRHIVLEKKLVQDSSKLKKPELLKLLEE
jgi:hypothetical protein